MRLKKKNDPRSENSLPVYPWFASFCKLADPFSPYTHAYSVWRCLVTIFLPNISSDRDSDAFCAGIVPQFFNWRAFNQSVHLVRRLMPLYTILALNNNHSIPMNNTARFSSYQRFTPLSKPPELGFVDYNIRSCRRLCHGSVMSQSTSPRFVNSGW